MNWISYPKTEPIPDFIKKTIELFEKYSSDIDSTKNDGRLTEPKAVIDNVIL